MELVSDKVEDKVGRIAASSASYLDKPSKRAMVLYGQAWATGFKASKEQERDKTLGLVFGHDHFPCQRAVRSCRRTDFFSGP